jgi:hypothetical protein
LPGPVGTLDVTDRVICDERGLSDAPDYGAHGYVSLIQMALFSQDEPSAHGRTAPKVPATPAESSCLPGETTRAHLVIPARQWLVKRASRRSVKLPVPPASWLRRMLGSGRVSFVPPSRFRWRLFWPGEVPAAAVISGQRWGHADPAEGASEQQRRFARPDRAGPPAVDQSWKAALNPFGITSDGRLSGRQ